VRRFQAQGRTGLTSPLRRLPAAGRTRGRRSGTARRPFSTGEELLDELLLEELELLEDDELELLLEDELLEEELELPLEDDELFELDEELELLLEEELELLLEPPLPVHVGAAKLPSWLPWKPNTLLAVAPGAGSCQPQQLVNWKLVPGLAPMRVPTFHWLVTVTCSGKVSVTVQPLNAAVPVLVTDTST
jgi:hypothetical protein